MFLIFDDVDNEIKPYSSVIRCERNHGKRYFSTTSDTSNSKPIPKESYKIPKWVDDYTISKYSRGDNLNEYDNTRSKFNRAKQIQRERKFYFANRTTAQAEILLTEQKGFIEPDEDDLSFGINQSDILQNVDSLTANKYFNLKLDQYGPYSMDYSRNGRDLLLGGTRGHLAGFEWHTKNLKFEINVGEAINCVRWLHTENMLAVGQKKWVHIYDNQGIELHCLKKLFDIQSMQFLPYHFLLCCGSAKGFLTWLDISLGKIVAHLYTGLGRSACNAMAQNPQNAVIHLGGHDGCVTLWSPNCSVNSGGPTKKEESSENLVDEENLGSLHATSAARQGYNVARPLAKLWCHRGPIRCVAVDSRGMYMATCDTDKNLHLWDLRSYKILDAFRLTGTPNRLTFSQNQLLAVSIGSRVEIYKDLHLASSNPYNEMGGPSSNIPYLSHKLIGSAANHVTDIQFCPYEDVLGIGHTTGFTSIIVPGSAEANIDSYEANPYQTVSQRKEMEVKALLGKIQPELISLDTGNINKVNVLSLQDKLEQRNKIMSLKPRKIDIHLKKKRKMKKGASARRVTARKDELLTFKKKIYYDDVSQLKALETYQAPESPLTEPTDDPNQTFQRVKSKHNKKQRNIRSSLVEEPREYNVQEIINNNLTNSKIIPTALGRFTKKKKRA